MKKMHISGSENEVFLGNTNTHTVHILQYIVILPPGFRYSGTVKAASKDSVNEYRIPALYLFRGILCSSVRKIL